MVTNRAVLAEAIRWDREKAAVRRLNRLGMATVLAGVFLGAAATGPPGAWHWWLSGTLSLAMYVLWIVGLVADWHAARRRLEDG